MSINKLLNLFINIRFKSNKIFIIFFCQILLLLFYFKKGKFSIRIIKENKNEIIKDNFFTIDSNMLENVESHMYGFSISKKGILTDNYYKEIGKYDVPDPNGVYIMIRKKGNELIFNQDYHGSFGLYFFENKKIGYFAISNSFLLLEEYLVGKQNFSFNKNYADYFIVTGLCSLSLNETMIKEISLLPPNAIITINVKTKKLKIDFIDYKEETVPLESEEGKKIIDDWIDKWGYIFRSLKKKTDNFYFDLSGGFDTRVLLSILLNSGINLKEIKVRSYQDNLYGHDEDSKIANNISSKFGFKLNNFKLDEKSYKWNIKDILFCTFYSKLGFHKEFYFKNEFYKRPIFRITGSGGEGLRGMPGMTINRYIKQISTIKIKSFEKKYSEYSENFLLKNVDLLKMKKSFNNDYEISSTLYQMGHNRNHFGKAALEGFIANIYFIQPLLDPDIKKIKYNINRPLSHDLVAYIYNRFAEKLMYFPFQGKRILDLNSIKKAKILSTNFEEYQIKSNYNTNFYIDNKKKFSESSSVLIKNPNKYLIKLFNSHLFKAVLNKIYDDKVYMWADDYSKKTKYFSLRYKYGLLAIAMTLEILSINEKFINNRNASFVGQNRILHYLINY